MQVQCRCLRHDADVLQSRPSIFGRIASFLPFRSSTGSPMAAAPAAEQQDEDEMDAEEAQPEFKVGKASPGRKLAGKRGRPSKAQQVVADCKT